MRIPSLRKHAGTLVCAWIAAGSACSSSLDSNLDNRSCSVDGQCVDGYLCSREHICVRASRSDATVRLAADGGTSRGGLALDPDAGATDPSEVHASSGLSAGSAGALASAGSSGASGTGAASSGAAGAPSATPNAGAAAPMPVAGASGSASSAGSPSTPASAGHGSMSPPSTCESGLELCGATCVDLTTDSQHCGNCDKHCAGSRTCVAGICVKPKDATDVAALATLLAAFGLDLSDLAALLQVDERDLASTAITLRDLKKLGVDEVALALLGFGADTLGLIGVDVSAD